MLSWGRIVNLLLHVWSENCCALEQAPFQVQCNTLGCCAISQCHPCENAWKRSGLSLPFVVTVRKSKLPFCSLPKLILTSGSLPVPFTLQAENRGAVLLWRPGKFYSEDLSSCYFIDSLNNSIRFILTLISMNHGACWCFDSCSYFCGFPFIFTTVLTPVIK